MPKFYTYPHTNIRVIDESARFPYIAEELPLHRPLFACVAERGEGMAYGTYDQLKEKFGEGTFDQRSEFFKHQNFFLRTACQNQPVFFFRLTPEDAKVASLVLEAHVWDDDLLLYQRDSDGNFVYLDWDNDDQYEQNSYTMIINAMGHRIPLMTGGPVIDNLAWSDNNQQDQNTYDLTITAHDADGGSLTYTLTCNDANVVINQDATDENKFHVTYPEYDPGTYPDGVSLTFSLTITASDSDSITTTIVQRVNPPANATYYGYWWNNDSQNAETMAKFKVNLVNNATANLVSDDTAVTISPDGTDPSLFNVTYGEAFTTAHEGDTYPITVAFTLTGTLNQDNETVNMTRSVEEHSPYPQATTPGVKVEWRVRPLAAGETLSSIGKSTYVHNSKTVTVYPIIALTPSQGPGKYGNDIGFTLFTGSDVDKDLIVENEARIFTIGFYDKPYGYDTPEFIRDFFNKVYNDFMFYPDGVYKEADMNLDFESVMDSAYRDNLPIDYHVYTDIFKDLCTRIKDSEDNETNGISELTTPWMVDPFTAISVDGIPYYRTEVLLDTTTAAMMLKDVIHYCSGGSDGDISDTNFETMAALFFKGKTFPELKDYRKWPFNHVYDSGFSLSTKEAMFDIMAIRDDVHVIVSTQDVSQDAYDAMTDQSAGSSLLAKALLYPESVLDGTQSCRVTIFSQCCTVNFDNKYKKLVPMSFFALLARSIWHNASFVKGEWKGLPNSSCDFVKWINWAPYDPDVKQLMWDTALNYCQYYDMTRLHYPDIVSVYPFQTSLLSSDMFVTYIVYMKQLVRSLWSKYAGVEESVTTLKSRIEKDLNSQLYTIFHNYVKVIPSVYETDLDKQLGYAMTVELAVYDSVAKRVWNVPIYVRRIEDLQTKK